MQIQFEEEDIDLEGGKNNKNRYETKYTKQDKSDKGINVQGLLYKLYTMHLNLQSIVTH